MVIHTCRLRPWFSPPGSSNPFSCLPLLSPLAYPGVFSDVVTAHSNPTAYWLSNKLTQTSMHLSWVITHQSLHVFVMDLISVEVILPPSIKLSPFSQVRKLRLKHFKKFSAFTDSKWQTRGPTGGVCVLSTASGPSRALIGGFKKPETTTREGGGSEHLG